MDGIMTSAQDCTYTGIIMTDAPHYTTNWYGDIPSDYPRILGNGAVREAAQSIAEGMTEAARTQPGPVVFVTGNSYVPALRSYPQAERVWNAENNADGKLFAFLLEELERLLSAADVYLGAPDYDNALYVVDLRRWQSSGTWDNFDGYYADDLNAEWEAVAHCPHPACTDPSDPHISHGDH